MIGTLWKQIHSNFGICDYIMLTFCTCYNSCVQEAQYGYFQLNWIKHKSIQLIYKFSS